MIIKRLFSDIYLILHKKCNAFKFVGRVNDREAEPHEETPQFVGVLLHLVANVGNTERSSSGLISASFC